MPRSPLVSSDRPSRERARKTCCLYPAAFSPFLWPYKRSADGGRTDGRTGNVGYDLLRAVFVLRTRLRRLRNVSSCIRNVNPDWKVPLADGKVLQRRPRSERKRKDLLRSFSQLFKLNVVKALSSGIQVNRLAYIQDIIPWPSASHICCSILTRTYAYPC